MEMWTLLLGNLYRLIFTDYTVCGVVENVNRFCEFAWSEVYAPYSSNAIRKVEAGETQGKSYPLLSWIVQMILRNNP